MTVEIKYANASLNMEITLDSLSNGGGWQSKSIDNSLSGANYVDYHIAGFIKTGSSPVATGNVKIFAFGSLDGITFDDGASGVDEVWINSGNAKFLGTIRIDATADATYEFGPFALKSALGTIPPFWSIGVENNSGDTLNATDHKIFRRGIKYEDV